MKRIVLLFLLVLLSSCSSAVTLFKCGGPGGYRPGSDAEKCTWKHGIDVAKGKK